MDHLELGKLPDVGVFLCSACSTTVGSFLSCLTRPLERGQSTSCSRNGFPDALPSLFRPALITYRPAASLKPFERYARTHKKKQIRKIADSIQAFGFTNPVLLDREGTIVAGHGRVAAARLLGMEEVPTVELEQLTPAQVRAYVIADNRWPKTPGSFCRSQHELFFVFKKGLCTHRNNVQLGRFGRNRTNLWQYPGASALSRSGEEGDLLAMHPTVKPVVLVADALLDASARGEVVLDCFLGSGSTLLAAERTGRACYGMELEPRYLDLAIRRWQQITGEPAVHAVTKQSCDELRAERPASESQEVAHA